MWRAERAVADKAVLIELGTVGTRCLPPSWDVAADVCLAMFHLGLERMWAQMEKLPGDAYHATESTMNAMLIGLHLARGPNSLLRARRPSSRALLMGGRGVV